MSVLGNNRRKTILINRKFQMTLILKFAGINILAMLIFGILIYIFLQSEIDANLRSAHVRFRNVSEIIMPVVISLTVINIIISTICIFFVIMYASFRIAGPLYKFNEAIKSIGRGNLHPMMVIRERDQLKECSISLQSTALVIDNHISKISDLITELEKSQSFKNNDSSVLKAAQGLREEVSFFRKK
jgi:hypothetical protein